MGTLAFLLAIIVFTLIGCMVGIVTGLVPGIHVNNVAYLTLAFQSSLISLAMWSFGWASPSASQLIIIVCSLVIGNAITHTFLDFIPSVFLGAPDADTALTLLPGHRMMLAGRGYEAVRCSVVGSFGAVIFALALLVPMRLVIGSPVGAYDALAEWMHLLLICVSIFLIMTETARPGEAFGRGKVTMRGHVLLGGLAPEAARHEDQATIAFDDLASNAGRDVILEASVKGVFRDCGRDYVLLGAGAETVVMELADRPRLQPTDGERVLAVGRVSLKVTWKDHALKRLLAAGVFMLAGLLGIAVLYFPGTASRNIFLVTISSVEQSTVLMFPLFTGLFGISTLLLSARDSPRIPEQKVDRVKVRLGRGKQAGSVASGCIASLASWFPGISSAISTLISVFLTRSSDSGTEGDGTDSETQSFIISVSAVNTSVALFNLVALFVIMKSRSGAMKAVEGLLSSDLAAWDPLGNVPMAMSALLLSALVAGMVSVPLTLFFGKLFARKCSKVDYPLLVKSVIVFLAAMVLVFSGLLGLVILAVATLVGMIPPLIGVKRVHLMGCLIVPVILFFV